MKGTSFAAYVRKLTKTNSTTFSDADIVAFANVVKDDLAAEVAANVDEGYFQIELTRDLESGIRNYTFANDILKHMNRLEVKLDGTNYKVLLEADGSQFDKNSLSTNTAIKSLYSGRAPEFLIRGRELIVLSGDDIDDVTNGIKMIAEIYPEDIDASTLASTDDLSIPSSTQTHALPRQVHKHWAIKVAIEYKQSRDKPIPLTQQEQKVDFDLQEVFKKLTPRNTNRSFIASLPYLDGQDY